MTTILVAVVLLAAAFVFMAAALHFAQYKKKQQSCCGDALEPHEQAKDQASCFTCPRRKEKEHCEEDPETCVHQIEGEKEPAGREAQRA